MAAEFETGMLVRVPAWHGKGNVINEWPGSWEEACKAADFEWDIVAEPVFVGGTPFTLPIAKNGTIVETQMASGVKEMKGWKAITRSDTGAVLDIAPPSYTTLSNDEFGEIIETVMHLVTDDVKYETLVVLRGGKMIAVTLRAPGREVPGDPSPLIPYIAGWTSHDRSAACKLGATMVRVVCANTRTAADNDMDGRNSGFVIKHTVNMKEQLGHVAQMLAKVFAQQDQMYSEAVELARTGISRTQVEEFVDIWIPVSSDQTARQLVNTHNTRARFWSVYEGELGQVTMEGIRGNAWGLLQAATETADWYTPHKNNDTLINRQLIAGDSRKAGAMKALARVL